jgi:hypothetical protein
LIKKFAYGLVLTLLIITGGISLLVYTNKAVIFHEITNQLRSSGLDLDLHDLELHVWTSFPCVSASIDRFSISTLDHKPVLTANELFFNLELKELLSGHIRIAKVILRDGHIHLQRDKNGNTNYTLQHSSEGPADQSLQLDHIELVRMTFTFHDQKQHHLIRLKEVNATIKPTFQQNMLQAAFQLKAFGEAISIDEISYLNNQPIDFQGNLSLENHNLQIQSALLQLQKTKLKFDGKIQALNTTSPEIDLIISKGHGQVECLAEFLPDIWFQSLTTYDITGNYDLRARIKGNLGAAAIPKIDIEAQLTDISLSHEAVLTQFKDGAGHLTFHYGNDHPGALVVNDFTAQHQGDAIDINFRFDSFTQPRIKTIINGEFNLADINPEILPDFLVHDLGRIRLEDFDIRSDETALTYQGRLHTRGIEGLFCGIAFSVTEGLIEADLQGIKILPTTLTSLGSDHEIEGVLHLDNEFYEINLQSEHVDLNRFFEALSSEDHIEAKNVSIETRAMVKTVVHLNAEQVQYDHINIGQTKADIKWVGDQIELTSDMIYCKGHMLSHGTYHLINGLGKFQIETSGVDVQDVFKQWNNFGQDQIEARHIRGKGDLQSIIEFTYLPDKPFNAKSLQAFGGLQIDNGELIDVPMLQQFTTYINQKDLSHIRFSSMSNVFKIAHGRFFLPEMFIQSNAANIILAGHQSLENELNYAIKINAGQVLTKKLKKHNPKLKPVRARNNGFFNLHYIIRGPLSDFNYFTDKRAVNDKQEQSLFLRDEVIQQLRLHFDTKNRYKHSHLMQDMPERDIDSAVEPEFVPGFE